MCASALFSKRDAKMVDIPGSFGMALRLKGFLRLQGGFPADVLEPMQSLCDAKVYFLRDGVGKCQSQIAT